MFIRLRIIVFVIHLVVRFKIIVVKVIDQVRVIRTERIWMKPNANLGYLCHISKNLYNEANYLIRQSYFTTGKKIEGIVLRANLQNSLNFKLLSQTTAFKIIKIVEDAWKSFEVTLTGWNQHPEKYFQ